MQISVGENIEMIERKIPEVESQCSARKHDTCAVTHTLSFYHLRKDSRCSLRILQARKSLKPLLATAIAYSIYILCVGGCVVCSHF